MAITMSSSGFTRILDTTSEEVNQDFSGSKTITEYFAQNIAVPDSTVDLAIAFGPVTTATAFHVESDQSITVKINGSATAQTVDPLLILYGSVTSMTVSNASGSTANMKIIAGGA